MAEVIITQRPLGYRAPHGGETAWFDVDAVDAAVMSSCGARLADPAPFLALLERVPERPVRRFLEELSSAIAEDPKLAAALAGTGPVHLHSAHLAFTAPLWSCLTDIRRIELAPPGEGEPDPIAVDELAELEALDRAEAEAASATLFRRMAYLCRLQSDRDGGLVIADRGHRWQRSSGSPGVR